MCNSLLSPTLDFSSSARETLRSLVPAWLSLSLSLARGEQVTRKLPGGGNEPVEGGPLKGNHQLEYLEFGVIPSFTEHPQGN